MKPEEHGWPHKENIPGTCPMLFFPEQPELFVLIAYAIQ